MSEWKEIYLTDAYTIDSGLSKPACDFGSGFPFLSFKNVFNNSFVPEKLSELVESNEKERLTCSIKRGDIFLTRTSETVKELGMSCVALTDFPNATFNGFTKRLRPNNNYQIVPEYVGYYLRSSKFRKEVTAMSSASTRASLNNEMIGRLKIVLPSQEEQKRIADVLSCLDAKIENLRRQNETLEKIAQMLFKHWFIDFEFPNADGKPYKSSGGVMVPSELGDIPEDWSITTIEKIASRIAMGPFGSRITTDNFVDSGIPIIRGNNLVNGFNEDSFVYLTSEKADELKSSNVFPEDIVFTHRGTLGQVGFIPTNAKYPRYVVSQSQMFLSVNKSVASPRFIYRFFSSNTSLKAIQIVLPDNKIMQKFHVLITSIDFKRDSNTKQIKTLTKIRDSLLPKLMSGQIRVKE
jgi:type I restriction enzyme S subunit